jgi:hypothetical protein
MTKLITQFSTKIGKDWIVSNQECPGSVKGNKHNLVIVIPESGNKLCKNEKCYFVIQYPDGSGAWQKDFDYKNAKF